ncbi:MAG: hypothetical protein ACP5UV_01615 [Thermoplasmata archaeon]
MSRIPIVENSNAKVLNRFISIHHNRLAIIALVIMIAGVSTTVYSYTLHPVYDTYFVQAGILDPSHTSFNFSQIPGYPENITMEIKENRNSVINYTFYSVSEYNVNGVQVVKLSLIKSGSLSGTQYFNRSVEYYSQNYEITVSGHGNYSISVNAVQIFPTREASDLPMEITGIAMIILSAIIFAVVLTKMSKK